MSTRRAGEGRGSSSAAQAPLCSCSCPPHHPFSPPQERQAQPRLAGGPGPKARTVAPAEPVLAARRAALGKHDAHCAPRQLRAVEVADGALGGGDVVELNEAKPARLARVALRHNPKNSGGGKRGRVGGEGAQPARRAVSAGPAPGTPPAQAPVWAARRASCRAPDVLHGAHLGEVVYQLLLADLIGQVAHCSQAGRRAPTRWAGKGAGERTS